MLPMRHGALILALLLPAAAHAQTIIIDDQDGAGAGFTTTGNDWTTWGMLGYGLDGADTEYHYLSHTVGGNDRVGTATWTPTIPTAGTYAISTWFRRTENRTDDADHFIYDGAGGVTHISLDQQGEGASGWVDLGQHWCAEGVGGCYVVLDGTDDNQSDEANAIQYVLVSADGDPPEPEPEPDCEEWPGFGAHTMEAYATTTAAVDWESSTLATGAPDGLEAHTPNVDAGEYLHASGWELCDPPGEETIDAVTIEVLVRTQYSSGPYALNLLLHAGGAAQTVFTGTSLTWWGVDVTAEVTPDWVSIAALTGQLQLWDHPNGNRDSDAWVDSWRILVDYTTTTDPNDVGDDDDDDDDTPPEGDDDDDATPESDDDDAVEDPEGDDDDSTVVDEESDDDDDAVVFEEQPEADGASDEIIVGCSCDQDLSMSVLLPLALLGLRRRSG